MERTKHSEKEDGKKELTSDQLRTFASQLVGRVQLMQQLGLQYGGDRDVYKALGYSLNLDYTDFNGRYARQDIAKAIIDRPVKATWQGPLELVESEKAEDTEFEKAWAKLSKNLKLKSTLSRLDKLTGIGHYGILVLGFNDVKDRDGFAKPVGKIKELMYVKPFGEKSAQIINSEDDPKNERYGLPTFYNVAVSDITSGMSAPGTTSVTYVKIHYSRVIHITDDPMESEVWGTPRLESVYNRLMDLEKLVGGDAEMFWRGARPGFEGKVDKDYQMTEAMKEDLKDQINEYENNLRRILVNEGVDLKALAQQIADPANHVDVQIQMISAVTGIPKRILTGSERGELASTQDSNEWKDYVQSRRDDFADPIIIRPLVDKLIELAILPKPANDYTVKWNDLYSLSEKARVEIGKGRANALREYTYSPMSQEVMPPNAFLEYCLGLTQEQITLVLAMRDKMISEDELNQSVIDGVNKPAPTPFGGGGGGATNPDDSPVIPTGKPIPKKAPVKITKPVAGA